MVRWSERSTIIGCCLGVVALFTLTVVGLEVQQARAVQRDQRLTATANQLVDAINSYSRQHHSVPPSLQTAYSGTIPHTITYTKVAAEAYQLCVQYETNSGAPMPARSDITQPLIGHSFVSSSHPAGLYCQELTPALTPLM